MAPRLDKVTRVWGKMKRMEEERTQDNPFCRTAGGHGARPTLLKKKKNRRNTKDRSGSQEGSSLPRDAEVLRFKMLFRQGVCFVRRWCSALWLLQQSVVADAWSTVSIISRESLLFPSWITDKMLQWQQKSGQVKHMPFRNGRNALVTRTCSLWTSKVNRVIFSLLLAVVTEKKQCTKVGWRQRGGKRRQKKLENENKLLGTLHRWEEISL